MKIKQSMKLQREPSADPLFEMHLDLTDMTAREFKNALHVIEIARPNFDVVLRKGYE